MIDEEGIRRARAKLEAYGGDAASRGYWIEQSRDELAVTDDAERLDLAIAWFEFMAFASQSRLIGWLFALRGVAGNLLARDVLVDEERLVRMVRAACRLHFPIVSVAPLVRALERAAARAALGPSLVAELRVLRTARGMQASSADDRRELARIDALLGVPSPTALPSPGEPWADRALADLAAMSDPERDAWHAMFVHAAASGSSQPSRAWLERARVAVETIGCERFESAISSWFPLIQKPAQLATVEGPHGWNELVSPIGDHNGDLLRGLVWSCATLSSPAVAALVGDLAVVCFAKIPNFGAVSPKVGNGCVFTLGACPGLTGVAQLARLKTRVKYAVANRLIEKAFDAAAKRTGFGRAELEDLSVPTFGLTGPGAGDFDVGEWSARITIGGDDTVSLTWRSPAGKEQAGVPAEVSRDHAATVKDLKKRVKDIGGMLTAQRLRLEGLLGGRAFALADFRSRILDHPLLAPIARRLVVEIRSGDRVTLAIWGDGDLVDVAGRAVADLSDDARVQLWHPIGSDVATVRAWRDVLYDRGITQPFKQAHREIYVLTDAERSTDTYSNRFAAHILRQHVLAALCRDRGWTYKLQGGFDGYNEPSRTIEGTELSAAFSVNPPEHAEAETSGAGIYLHVLSDHVRFYRGGREAVPLAEVPPLVFSETMRDIDLFVALASVGNDPDWVDRGNGQLGEYWQGFAFGELSATARTRHEVLERLLPRLKIADRCRLMDRFLVVRGDLRVYKIHLGSANILMEPNDQYLCIVPGRSSGSKGPGLRLPFEGDSTLSLILSKAILLAADTKIADPSIVGQIGRP